MVSRFLARLKKLRKAKRFNLFWQLSVSRYYSRIRKTFPDAHALLALVYPPGYVFFKDQKDLTKPEFRMLLQFSRELGLHGLFQSELSKLKRKLMLRRNRMTRQTISLNLPQLTPQVQNRVANCMPHVTPRRSLELMEHEASKHVPEIDFLNLNTYPVFTVAMFERYEFNRLLSFVVVEVSKNQTPVWEFSYFKEEWIGIRLADLSTIAERYPPISEVGRKSKLTFRLIPSKLVEDQFFLFEVHVGVTRSGRLTRGGPISSVFRKVKEIPTPESIVLLAKF